MTLTYISPDSLSICEYAMVWAVLALVDQARVKKLSESFAEDIYHRNILKWPDNRKYVESLGQLDSGAVKKPCF